MVCQWVAYSGVNVCVGVVECWVWIRNMGLIIDQNSYHWSILEDVRAALFHVSWEHPWH